MARKTAPLLPTTQPDVRADYAVIAMAIGAAFVALVYLILI